MTTRHGRQQGQAAVGIGHGFIGNRGTAGGQQIACLIWVRREVEVGEQQLAFAQHFAFARLRFLDLNDHVGGGKNLFGGVQNGGTGGDVIGILKARALACAGLYDHRVPVFDGFFGGVGGQANAEFLRLQGDAKYGSPSRSVLE